MRLLSGNALASSASTVFNAVLLFVFYRFLVQKLGIEQIGVWSLVFATCGVARLGEFGMAGGVAKFVGNDLGASKPSRAITTIVMSACFLLVVVGMCALLIQPFVYWVLTHTVEDAELVLVALKLVPWTLAAVWMAAMVNLLCAALDGNQRTVLRCLAMMIGGVVQLVLAYRWIPIHGLEVLGRLQFSFLSIQALLLLASLLWVMKQPLVSWISWDNTRFIKMLKYGAGLQITTVGQLLFEPTVRWLLGVYSGLTLTGYYELASRAIVQFRLAITAAFQMIVPFYATRIGRIGESRAEIQRAYRRTFRLLLIISTPYFLLIGCVLPFLFTWWTGVFSESFIWVGLICLLGWYINILAVPAFMLYLAIGKLQWVAVTQIVIGSLNLLFGLLLGHYFGGLGVVVAAMMALSIGSCIVLNRFQKEYDISSFDYLPKTLIPTTLLGMPSIAFFAWFAMHWRGVGVPPIWLLAVLSLVAAAMAGLAWRDPLRNELMQRLRAR